MVAWERADWLLLFIGLPGGQYPTDQIRIMKGMFLFTQEGPPEVRRVYRFVPYDYGPFAPQIYHDLDWLEATGLLRVEVLPSTNRRIYRLTKKGEDRVAELRTQVSAPGLRELERIKQKVTSLSFLDLLGEVYNRYPRYAAKSKISR